MLSEPLLVVARLARAFDGLGIRYLVRGFARQLDLRDSPCHSGRRPRRRDRPDSCGIPRQRPPDEFCVDAGMIRDAIRRRASFNVVHLATMFKADVFIGRDDAWSREEMARARAEEIDTPEGRVAVRFASPEDILVHKLVWYQLGDQVSDRQWGDIVGVIRVQVDSLDVAYLRSWATSLGVSDLLVRAWPEGTSEASGASDTRGRDVRDGGPT